MRPSFPAPQEPTMITKYYTGNACYIYLDGNLIAIIRNWSQP